jgi:hypothetical protein
MSDFPEAWPHGSIEELFPDVFFVSGTMIAEFFGAEWQFSRNMTVVREDGNLTLISAVRLDDEGLAALDALGKVTNVVRIGSMHNHDDAFYVDRYGATYWAMPGMPGDTPKVDKELSVGGELPVGNASLFVFEHTKLPESILRLDRDGGIMIACDALQNWAEPDELIREDTVETMKGMNFFQKAGIGPAWMHVMEPKPEDFVRLKEVPFKHVLCGHGTPLRDTAQDDFHGTFKRVFDV